MVSYGQPEDPAAFDAYYQETHTPLALRQPGLLRLSFGRPRPLDPSQAVPYLVASLDFESEDAMQETLDTPEGRAAGKDIRNFATGGVTFAHFEVHEAQQG
jgi:uncharacterized protein (TIGR02118 family)